MQCKEPNWSSRSVVREDSDRISFLLLVVLIVVVVDFFVLLLLLRLGFGGLLIHPWICAFLILEFFVRSCFVWASVRTEQPSKQQTSQPSKPSIHSAAAATHQWSFFGSFEAATNVCEWCSCVWCTHSLLDNISPVRRRLDATSSDSANLIPAQPKAERKHRPIT